MNSATLPCPLVVPKPHQHIQMAPDGVGAILNGDVKSLEDLEALAPDVTNWLLESLGQTHEDKALKRRLKALLGNHFYVSNLKHFGLWDELLQKCSAQALDMGQEMKAYFEAHNLGVVLGMAYPNVTGKVEPRRFMSFLCFPLFVWTLPHIDVFAMCNTLLVEMRGSRWQYVHAVTVSARRGWTVFCHYRTSKTQARANCGMKCRSFISCG